MPAALRQAADKVVAQAKWTEATKESDDGETVYGLNGTDARGREVSLTLMSDGQVKIVVTVLSVTDLPKSVVDVLRTLTQEQSGPRRARPSRRADHL